MSTLNVANLELQITRKIANTTDNKELAILNKALYVLQTGVIFTVGTFANLPSPSENEGKLYFVEADALLYFSFTTEYGSVTQWIPITNVSANNLWSWGCNLCGLLGNGTTVSRCSPGTTWGNYTTWRQVSSGSNYSAAIKTDGTLWTWGSNVFGNLGNGTTIARSSPGTVTGGGINWCCVSVGGGFISAIKTDGTLWTWGFNSQGRLGNGNTIDRCSPGTVADGGTTWSKVSSTGSSGLSIKTDGTLWTWGFNGSGKLGDGTTVARCSPGTIFGGGTTWCDISVGAANSVAIKTDGTLWTWGDNDNGKLGDGTTTGRCSPGTIAGGGTTWCQVSAGACHISSIKTDGTLWTWGCGVNGVLGEGTTVNRCSPGTTASGGTTWCEVSLAVNNSAAIKTDGTLWTWGCGCSGSLGDGTTVDRCSPGTTWGSYTTWWKVSSGCNRILAITKETL